MIGFPLPSWVLRLIGRRRRSDGNLELASRQRPFGYSGEEVASGMFDARPLGRTMYKVLGHNGKSLIADEGTWPLPAEGRPGAWMPKKELGDLENDGYHFCRGEIQLVLWLGHEIWLAEQRGALHKTWDKTMVQQGRLLRKLDAWNQNLAEAFTRTVAQRALSQLTADYPDHEGVRNSLRRIIVHPVSSRWQGLDGSLTHFAERARQVALLGGRIARHNSIRAFGFGGNMSGALLMEHQAQGQILYDLLYKPGQAQI